MALVVFLKGINVGGHRRFRPTVAASKMSKLGVINVGAAGTFIIPQPVSQARLRLELRRCLPFETETMICSGNDILELASAESFAGKPCSADAVRFVGIMAKRARVLPSLPLRLPPGDDWLVQLVEIRGRFALGLYRRSFRTITALSQLEKHLGGPLTIRNWNTVLNLCEILRTLRGK
jgi:uncharacterized protein (DUF1697 family)